MKVDASIENKPRNTAERILDGVITGTGPILSIREAYAVITGDRGISGLAKDLKTEVLASMVGAEEGRFSEAVSTMSFAKALANSVNRQVSAFYPSNELHRVWRALAKVVTVEDFRVYDFIRYGGYSNLPIVAETANYPALVSPVETKGSFAVAKRGGTESISREAIKNDDVAFLREIPKLLILAAAETLAEFVTDFLRSPPTMPDLLPVFHASTGNLGSASLNPVSYMVGFNAIRAQGRPSGTSERRLDLEPRNIWVPVDLEETAFNMFQRNLNQDFNFYQSRRPNIQVVHWWNDLNDWCLSAGAEESQAVVVGFLEGREDPEIVVQDLPGAGSMFSNDRITLKIHHTYGGNVMSRRGLYKAVVP